MLHGDGDAARDPLVVVGACVDVGVSAVACTNVFSFTVLRFWDDPILVVLKEFLLTAADRRRDRREAAPVVETNEDSRKETTLEERMNQNWRDDDELS